MLFYRDPTYDCVGPAYEPVAMEMNPSYAIVSMESSLKKQVFRVKKLVGRRWGAPNSNYLLAMGWPLLSCHV